MIPANRKPEPRVNGTDTEQSPTPQSRGDLTAAGWCGIMSFAGIIAAPILTLRNGLYSWPTWDEPTETWRLWFSENRGLAITQVYITNVAFVLGIPFAVGLSSYLRQRLGPTLVVQTITPAAATTTLMYITATASWTVAVLAGTPSHPFSEPLMRGAVDTGAVIYLTGAVFPVLLMLCAGAAILQAASLPRWTGWSALVIAVLNLASTFIILAPSGWLAPVGPGSYAAMLLVYIWFAAIGAVLLRARPRPTGRRGHHTAAAPGDH